MEFISAVQIENEFSFYKQKIEVKEDTCSICYENTNCKPFLCEHYCCPTCLSNWNNSNSTSGRDRKKCFICNAQIKFSYRKSLGNLKIIETYTEGEKEQFLFFGLKECQKCYFWSNKDFCLRCYNNIDYNPQKTTYIFMSILALFLFFTLLIYVDNKQCNYFLASNNIDFLYYKNISSQIKHLEKIIEDRKFYFNYRELTFTKYQSDKKIMEELFREIKTAEQDLENVIIQNWKIYNFNKKHLYFHKHCV